MTPPVVEVSDAPYGLTEIKVKDSHGVRIGFCQFDAESLDDELMSDLKRWQIRHAGAFLSVIRASGGSVLGSLLAVLHLPL